MKNIKRKWNDVTSWRELAKLGNKKLVQRMYIWLFITPSTVKLLDTLENWMIESFQNNIQVDLSLPFSWWLFFFASLAFTIGNIWFSIFCPNIIRNHANYGDFAASRLPPLIIWEFLSDFSTRGNNKLNSKLGFPDNESIQAQYKHDNFHLKSTRKTLIKQPFELFYDVYTVANEDYSRQRLVVFFLYSVGILLFSWVVVENILYVIGQF
jgi:hypothetical protein